MGLGCTWTLVENGAYVTNCYYAGDNPLLLGRKNIVHFEFGDVRENNYNFCPYCGGRIHLEEEWRTHI